MKFTSIGLMAFALALSSDVEALPSVRQYRGVSRYAGVNLPPTEAPKLRDPREYDGARTMRLSSNAMAPDTYLDELHYVNMDQDQFWGNVKDRLETAISKLDRITSLLGVGNLASLQKASSLVQGAAQTFGIHLNFGKSSALPDFTFDFNSSQPLRWGSEVDASAVTRQGCVRANGCVDPPGTEPNVPTPQMPSLPQDSGFDYNKEKVRGVNLGNWLLFEGWMDSDLMDQLNLHAINAPYPNPIIDEWTAGLYSDPGWASYVLQKHFDEWMTEDDWKAIKDAGLNHVRIPVPYFIFAEAKGPNAPYLTLNRFAKLKEGVQLAKKYGLKVWIDLHSVPGSQNGYDNSGRAGPVHWANNSSYYTQTQYAFNRLVNEFVQADYKNTVTAIEAVNEPWGKQNSKVQDLLNTYYPWARNKVARPDGWTDYSTMLLAVHDAFQGLQYWQNFWTGRARHRVLLDTHPYFVYTDSQKKKKDIARLQEVCDLENSFVTSQKYYPSIAGEFGINGPNGDRAADRDLPVGPVKFPNGPAYPYSVKYMAFMARNFRTQQYVYEKGAGWIMWSWRNDNALDWSYQTGLKWGWIPKHLNAKPYGNNPCSDLKLMALQSAAGEFEGQEEDQPDYY